MVPLARRRLDGNTRLLHPTVATLRSPTVHMHIANLGELLEKFVKSVISRWLL